MRLLRRILLPAVIAVPFWMWAMIFVIRPKTFEWEIPDLSSWLFGAFFGCIGILIVCLPLAERMGPWIMHRVIKLALMVVVGAAGGFCIIAALGLIASWFEFDGFVLGIFGLLPGAITAAIWAALNFDLIKAKEPSLA